MVLPSPPTSFAWRNAMRQTLSVSLGERVASDWRCRCAIASPRLLLPIPKGEPRQAYTTQHNAEATTQETTGQTLCLFRSCVCTLAYSAHERTQRRPDSQRQVARCTERNSSERCP